MSKPARELQQRMTQAEYAKAAANQKLREEVVAVAEEKRKRDGRLKRLTPIVGKALSKFAASLKLPARK